MASNADLIESANLVQPNERLKYLIDFSSTIDVDHHIPPIKYYRSGLEMVRMADVYVKEGNLENAYVLYLKFMILFLEKIRKHPKFGTVPSKDRAINHAKLKEVLGRAEKLKVALLTQYETEYQRYRAERDSRRERERGSYDTVPSFVLDPSREPSRQSQLSGPGIPEEAAAVADKPDVPAVDRSVKPPSLDGRAAALRRVIVPGRLMQEFLMKARRNTVQNVETCGILAGKLERNQLIITDVILPKQKGGPDTCSTMNEEEIFDYQDQQNLITIGWVHTHPTQTAFLSSVDLHTHCPYQLLMPEALAIVCAPRYNETGFFTLTPSYGLKFIADCRQSGFHPHPTDPPLFATADHFKIDETCKVNVVDLRL